MLPVLLDPALLRLQVPDLVLRPGMQVVARVASRGEGGLASLVLAGALLKATVPEEVSMGQTLRLTVAETSSERIVLRMDGAEPPLVGLAPGPDAQRRAEADGGGASHARAREGEDAIALVYDVPALGRLDLRVQRGREGVVVSLGTSAGWHGPATDATEALRTALETRLGVPAVVRVVPRGIDAYA